MSVLAQAARRHSAEWGVPHDLGVLGQKAVERCAARRNGEQLQD
jgi:hypothetical protein